MQANTSQNWLYMSRLVYANNYTVESGIAMKNVNSIVHSTIPVHFPVKHKGITPPLYFA